LSYQFTEIPWLHGPKIGYCPGFHIIGQPPRAQLTSLARTCLMRSTNGVARLHVMSSICYKPLISRLRSPGLCNRRQLRRKSI